jgi:hypothetical protein
MTNRLVQPHIAKSSVRKRIFREPGLCVARRGLPPSADDAVDGGSAQIPLIRWRLRERVVSDPLLPFAMGLGTVGGRQRRTSAWLQLSFISTRCAAVAVKH